MKNARRLLLILSVAWVAWAALVVVTGGLQFRLAGIGVRSRDPVRPLAIGLVLLLAYAVAFPDSFRRGVDRVTGVLRPMLPAIALACGLALAWSAIRFGTFTAGGSDSYGYVSQAYGWASRTMFSPQTLPLSLPWPSGDASLAPLGYSPGPSPHTTAPIYPPGLPLMMAVALVFGACGPFLVVPICAAVLVWWTFLLGRRTGGPWAGVLAALFVASSPIVIFQSMWPMSDVPSAAIWTGAALAVLAGSRRSCVAAGLLAMLGLLVRPNLPIVPLVLLAHLALSLGGRERWIRLALFSAPVALAALAIGSLYTAWHGAPWNSGFGGAGEIFSAGNIIPNLARYPVWLWESQSPLVLLAIVPLLPWTRNDTDPAAVRLCAALFAGTLITYLVYAPFEEWWYLRFLLPAIPAALVLIASGATALGRRVPPPWGSIAVAGMACLMLTHALRFSGAHGVFGPLQAGERRYADVGSYVAEALPKNALVFAVQQSGSIRYYSGRMTIRWDLIDREWTGRAAAEVERLGLRPYMVVEDWELPQMWDWFGLPPNAPPPWPLVARMREPIGVSVLDMSTQPPERTIPVALTPGRAALCSAQQRLNVPAQ